MMEPSLKNSLTQAAPTEISVSYLCFRVAFYVQTICGEPTRLLSREMKLLGQLGQSLFRALALENLRRGAGHAVGVRLFAQRICKTCVRLTETFGLAVDVLFRSSDSYSTFLPLRASMMVIIDLARPLAISKTTPCGLSS